VFGLREGLALVKIDELRYSWHKALYASVLTDIRNIIVSRISVPIIHTLQNIIREYIYISFDINNKKPTISSGFIKF
jgi:hypothetical protein